MWSGRIGMQVRSDPPQSLSAGFELKGRPAQGELVLTGPLGSVLAVMRWAPGDALLQGMRGQTRFSSIDDMLLQTTGAAVPLAGLFEWLAGRDAVLNGWKADLSRHAEGRITALRTAPLPEVELRIVLDGN